MNSRLAPMVVVISYMLEHQADIAYAKLLVAGIREVEVVHSTATGWNPFAVKAPGMYAVMVPTTALKKAKKILRIS